MLHHALVHPNVNVRELLENDSEAYYSKDEFLEPLTLIYNSLLTCGDKYIAHGRLLDCIRQVLSLFPGIMLSSNAGRPVSCFVPMDVRSCR